MKFNKKLAKTLVFALALGVLPFGAKAMKASASATAAKFDNKTGTFTAKSGVKFWAVAKPVKSEKKANVVHGGNNFVIKPADIEAYAGGINAAALGEGKDLYIATGTADTVGQDGKYANWEVKKISAANKKFKVYYFGAEHGKIGKVAAAHDLGGAAGYLAAEVAEGKKTVELNLAENNEKVFVKVGDGAWVTLKAFVGGAAPDNDKVTAKLKTLVQRGASLSFKYAPDDDTWFKEAKLKIPAQPKAPKLGVDTKKDLLTSLKKGMQYQKQEITTADDPAMGDDWETVADKQKSVALGNGGLALANDKNYLVFARNSGDTKKISSKVSKIRVLGTEALTKGAAISAKPEGVLIKHKSAETPFLTLSLVRKFDVKKGAIITNKTTDDYEIFVNGGTEENLPDKAKWTLLKGKKTAEAKDVVLKLKYNTARKANSYSEGAFKVLVRKAGSKLVDNVVTMPSAVTPVDVTLGKIEQTGSIVDNSGGTESVSDTAIAANYTAGEEKEITFKYKITAYQKFDKKPKLEFTKTPNVSVKVESFEEEGANAVAVISVKISKKATGNVVQDIKISAEGAAAITPKITFTATGA